MSIDVGMTIVNRPKVICLCGSSRFVAEMAVFAWELEKRGVIALGMHLLPRWYEGLSNDHQAEAEGVAEQMDELHKRKIDLADEILVMNVGGYIGTSTRSEIAYAHAHGKLVRYLEVFEKCDGRSWWAKVQGSGVLELVKETRCSK